MTGNDVTDSTDWLSTPLPGLAAVEAAFRCQVCKDFYNTPMITSCSHTFCSLCIRRALSSDGRCPMCRALEQEMKLRSNWSMEEAVEAFKKARPATLELARTKIAARSPSPKRKAEAVSPNSSNAPPETKRLRTSARLSSRQRSYAEVDHLADDEVAEPIRTVAEPQEGVAVAQEDQDYVPEPADGLVPCPVCQQRMKEWQVFAHLESCSGPQTQQSKPPTPHNPSPLAIPNGFTQAQRVQNQTMERLPPINYSLFKDTSLRRRMADLGISSSGPRHLMEKRHKEWITLWNANCDSIRPKKRSQLLQDLEVWERTQGARVVAGRLGQSNPAVKDKDFDGSAWATKHDTSFKDLIASARKSRAEASRKRDEDDPKTDPAGPTDSAPEADPAHETQQNLEIGGTALLAMQPPRHDARVGESRMDPGTQMTGRGDYTQSAGDTTSHPSSSLLPLNQDTTTGNVNIEEPRPWETWPQAPHQELPP